MCLMLMEASLRPSCDEMYFICAINYFNKISRNNIRMQRVSFKMKLFEGYAEEYKNRHDRIWGELRQLLKETGVRDYSIFLDEETNSLFAYLTVDDERRLEELPSEPVMKKWWSYMKDIMETNEDNSPVSIPLKEIFYLP
jgi:L-rhamnose mutarotase